MNGERLEAVRMVVKMNVEGRKGRPKKRWLVGIENDVRTTSVNEGRYHVQ